MKLMEQQRFPSVSIYLPVHRQRPENEQDRIRFKNALKKIESDLIESDLSRQDYEPILEQLKALERETPFWGSQLDGLAIFCSSNYFSTHRLTHKVAETIVVADSFHVKPLIRATQSADRFHVLLLSQDLVRVYEGNRYALERLHSPDLPTSLVDALGPEVEEDHLTVASYGQKGSRRRFAGSNGPTAMYHGHSKKKDKKEADLERFYRQVDSVVRESHSNRSRFPLILVALPESQAIFRRISSNNMLLSNGLDLHPSSMDDSELQRRVGEFIRKNYKERAAGEIRRFHAMKSQKLASDDLKEIGQALRSGKVETLLVEGEKFIPGVVEEDGTPRIHREADKGPVDDLLDDLSEETLKQGGEVIVLHAVANIENTNPSGSVDFPFKDGVGAIYRY